MSSTRPDVALIVAQASNRVIGRNNQLPWHLPADLRHFKRVTMGKPIIMGRKTFESIGRPLPGRLNIVISRQPGWAAPGVRSAGSLAQAIALAAAEAPLEIMVIGGAQVYAEALPLAARIYLTEVHHACAGDAWFPLLDAADWVEATREEHPAEGDSYGYAFVTLEAARTRRS